MSIFKLSTAEIQQYITEKRIIWAQVIRKLNMLNLFSNVKTLNLTYFLSIIYSYVFKL
jgi:hypothetical protein